MHAKSVKNKIMLLHTCGQHVCLWRIGHTNPTTGFYLLFSYVIMIKARSPKWPSIGRFLYLIVFVLSL